MRRRFNSQKGFTLVEIIAVLILLGILAAVAVPRYVSLTGNAEARAIGAAVAELNGRENMTWANIMLSATGWQDDGTTFAAVNTNLGTDYTWASGPSATAGGSLTFGSTTVALTRAASTATTPGIWTTPAPAAP